MTNEKMPRDSAKTTMMMPFVRIAFAASGVTPGRLGDLRAGDADPETRTECAKTDRDASA